ncbi:RBBP9/YdeN family alpha/beta hydrolase [Streptomyces virginiae]
MSGTTEPVVEAGRSVRTVPPLTQDGLSCEARVAALDKVMVQIAGPVVLVAHSTGVATTVHRSRRHPAQVQVQRALLVTPPDVEQPLPEGHPTTDVFDENGWIPVPRSPLPFAAAASRNASCSSLRAELAGLLPAGCRAFSRCPGTKAGCVMRVRSLRG